jgi:hypothetical protein
MQVNDWTGNAKSIFVCHGASNHTDKEREQHDYYATDPRAVEILLENETFSREIWEPACGEGHIAKVLQKAGYDVYSSDLIYRGFGDPASFDFLKEGLDDFNGDIITNPPYKYALEFCQTALETVKTGRKVAMFLKLTFLEGKKRQAFFLKNPPKTVYVFSARVKCAKNGDFESLGSSAVAYAWYVWEKGKNSDPVIKWIN